MIEDVCDEYEQHTVYDYHEHEMQAICEWGNKVKEEWLATVELASTDDANAYAEVEVMGEKLAVWYATTDGTQYLRLAEVADALKMPRWGAHNWAMEQALGDTPGLVNLQLPFLTNPEESDRPRVYSEWLISRKLLPLLTLTSPCREIFIRNHHEVLDAVLDGLSVSIYPSISEEKVAEMRDRLKSYRSKED
jgi:hypothetical protein